MESVLNKSINKYYLLKKQYTNDRDIKKKEIMKNKNFSLKDKKLQVSQIKQSCIFCQRNVGTLFYKKDGILYATCKDSENPCDKSIEIKTGQYLQLTTIIEYLQKDINDIVEEIINNKTKLVLGYDISENVIPIFEEYMELYNDSNEIFMRLKQKLEFFDLKQKKTELDNLYIEFNDYVKNIKKILKENMDSSINNDTIRETNTIYKDYLMPLEEKINELRFKFRELNTINTAIEQDNNILYMKYASLKEHETLHDMEDPEVIKMDVPMPKQRQQKQPRQPRQKSGLFGETIGLGQEIKCEITDDEKCPVKFNSDNMDYTLPINQNYDCDNKKLVLKLHPDKNTGCSDCATEVSKLYNAKCN